MKGMKFYFLIIIILTCCNLFAQQKMHYMRIPSNTKFYRGLEHIEILPKRDSNYYIGIIGDCEGYGLVWPVNDSVTGIKTLKDTIGYGEPPAHGFELIKAFFCSKTIVRGWSIKFDPMMKMERDDKGMHVYIITQTNPKARFYKQSYTDTLSIDWGFDEKLNIKIK